jgi:predicted RNase H-like nuclease (RuvC/YqgF family)
MILDGMLSRLLGLQKPSATREELRTYMEWRESTFKQIKKLEGKLKNPVRSWDKKPVKETTIENWKGWLEDLKIALAHYDRVTKGLRKELNRFEKAQVISLQEYKGRKEGQI